MTRSHRLDLGKSQARALLPALLCAALAAGACALGGGNPPEITEYGLEYKPPPPIQESGRDATIKVEGFCAAAPVDSTAMVYEREDHTIGNYGSRRWIAEPGTLVSDFLRRDLVESRRFKAVFFRMSPDRADFDLQGVVDRFGEKDGASGPQAVLTLTVTLLDMNARPVPERIVFQKTYEAEEPMKEKSASALASALSRALKTLSGEIAQDVYGAVPAPGTSGS